MAEGPETVSIHRGAGNRQQYGVQRRHGRQLCDLEALPFVEGLPRQQGVDERVKWLAVGTQEALGLAVAVAVALKHPGVAAASSL
jgi:hypothetical protein